MNLRINDEGLTLLLQETRQKASVFQAGMNGSSFQCLMDEGHMLGHVMPHTHQVYGVQVLLSRHVPLTLSAADLGHAFA